MTPITTSNPRVGFRIESKAEYLSQANNNSEIDFIDPKHLRDHKFDSASPNSLEGPLDDGFFAGLFRNYRSSGNQTSSFPWTVQDRTHESGNREIFLSVNGIMTQETLNQVVAILDAKHLTNEEKEQKLGLIASQVTDARALFIAADYFLTPSVMSFALKLDLERTYGIQGLVTLQSLPIEDPRFKEASKLYKKEKEKLISEISRLVLTDGVPVSYLAMVDALIAVADAKVAKYNAFIEDKNLFGFWEKVRAEDPFSALANPPVFVAEDTECQKAEKIRRCLDANTDLLSTTTSLDLCILGLDSLPKEISKFTQLQTLNLLDNQIQELPDTIGNLSQLQVLCLRKNQIQELPDAIGNLAQLETLDLSSNQIQELPDAIGNLARLVWLNLPDNQIRELPNAIGNLAQLQMLYLKNNKIQEIPDTIRNLSQLQVLDLQNNQIQKLPDTIRNLSESIRLRLDGNPLNARVQ